MDVIDLESLACVEALARTLRFRAAAQSMALSPAAFGKRVQQVEEHLETAIFVRTTRKVQLTPAGAALLPRVRRLLKEAQSLKGAARGTPPQVDLVIGTRHELGMSWLLPARDEIKRSQPHLTIHLRFGSAPDLESALLLGRLDAAVLSRPPPTRKIESVPLHREEYVLVTSPKRAAIRTLEDVGQHPLIDADDTLPLASYLRGVRLRPASVITMGTIEAIRALVRAGEGIAVLPKYFVEDDLKKKRLVRALRNLDLAHDEFRLLFRGDHTQRAALVQLADALSRLPLT